jgi:hypothetical protein
MADSFTVTLVSNQNDDEFANNTSSSFSNALPRTMDLSNYELALQSIHLTDHFPSNVALGNPNEEKQFFDLDNKENEITVIMTTATQYRVSKKTDVLSNFIEMINTDLEYIKFPLAVTPTFTAGKVTGVTLKYTPKPGFTLNMRGSLGRILGFTTQQFEGGTFENEKPVDETFFKSLSNGNVGDFTEFKDDRELVEVDQIPEKPDLEVVLGFIKAALDEKKHKFIYDVDNKNASVSFQVVSLAKRVLLSEFLNRYMGLPPAFVFHDKGSFRVHKNVLFPSKVKQPPVSCSKLLVMCDIIQPQIFAGRELPLLAVLERNHTTVPTETTFEPRSLVYKPTDVGKVSHIAISIQSDNNQNITHQTSPTVVNLHFRKMRDIKCDEKRSCKLVRMNSPERFSNVPSDLILLERSPSRSPSPERFVVKRKQIKAASGGKAVSSKKLPVGRGRPKQPSKPVKKLEVKRGRPAKVSKPQRGRPPIKQTKKTNKK